MNRLSSASRQLPEVVFRLIAMTAPVTFRRLRFSLVPFSIACCLFAAGRSASEGVYSKDQMTRGQGAYREECGKCHGQELGGGEGAPALVGKDFLASWQGKTTADLFDRIIKTMPSDDPGSLSRRKCADVTAYILSANGFPAGARDLDSTAESLAEIRIDPKK